MDSVEFTVLERIAAALEKHDETLGYIYGELQTMNGHLDDLSCLTALIEKVEEMSGATADAIDSMSSKLSNTIRQKDFTRG